MKTDIDYLREAIDVSLKARADGNHPFGALLVSPEGDVLIRGGNTHKTEGGTGHAELNVAREACVKYDPEYLEKCTLYTTFEPCSMCSGGAYWAGIGTVVYGVSELRLAELTGDNTENLTMALDCRKVLQSGQRMVEVRGPFTELEAEIVKTHEGFWD